MESPSIPDDEDERVGQLAALDLDSHAHRAELEPWVRKLAGIFEVEIAMVTTIDRHRQRFLAHSGLPEKMGEITDIARDVSICGHVVAANQILMVEDLARDRRFANNPFVREYGLRFYIGVPLRAPGGKAFGTLCLMSFTPRRFTPREIRHLNHHADEIAAKLAVVGE